MKPASFEYAAPESLEEALALLDEGSRPLAGGQSLMPLLNARLARPRRLVDLNRIEGHDHVREEDGRLRIGMLARQGELTGLDRWPLLREAALHVGHPATRTRGTVCGSVAAGSPRAELPAALRVLGASYRVRSPRGERVLDAFPPLEPDELLVEIEVPPHPERWRFFEYAPTLGDWPHVGVAVAGDRIEEFGVALGEPWQRAMIEAALA